MVCGVFNWLVGGVCCALVGGGRMNLTIQQVADIAEYAAMRGIPFEQAAKITLGFGIAQVRTSLNRGVVK